MATIYALVDPRTKEVRYVGKTSQPLQIRLNQHWNTRTHRNNHKECWLRNLEKEKLKPFIRVLEECPEDLWQEREIYWMTQFDNLTNTCEGGGGSSAWNAPHAIKLSKYDMKEAMTLYLLRVEPERIVQLEPFKSAGLTVGCLKAWSQGHGAAHGIKLPTKTEYKVESLRFAAQLVKEGYSHKQAAEVIGTSRPSVSRFLRSETYKER